MKAITGETREEVWFEAIKHLRDQAEDHIEYNLILEVSKPSLNNRKQKIYIMRSISYVNVSMKNDNQIQIRFL